MTGTAVLDCFFLYSLLLEADERSVRLELPHQVQHAHRLMRALNERNASNASNGLKHWLHSCDGCFKLVEAVGSGRTCKILINRFIISGAHHHHLEDTVSAAVTDGVTLGHPCCNAKDCKDPLARVSDEFCHKHMGHGSDCCVRQCVMPRENGYRTCIIPEHRAEELKRKMRGRKVVRRPRTGEADAVIESRGGGGKKKSILGAFSRKWTHNEQLMVRTCGVVIGRSTFYESENMIAVKVRTGFEAPVNLSSSSSGFRQEYLPPKSPRSGARNPLLRQCVWLTETLEGESRQRHARQNGDSSRRIPLRRPQRDKRRLQGTLRST